MAFQIRYHTTIKSRELFFYGPEASSLNPLPILRSPGDLHPVLPSLVFTNKKIPRKTSQGSVNGVVSERWFEFCKGKSGNLNLFLGILLFFPCFPCSFQGRKGKIRRKKKGLDYQIFCLTVGEQNSATPFLPQFNPLFTSILPHFNLFLTKFLPQLNLRSARQSRTTVWKPPSTCPWSSKTPRIFLTLRNLKNPGK